jgi:hypothetical protein
MVVMINRLGHFFNRQLFRDIVDNAIKTQYSYLTPLSKPRITSYLRVPCVFTRIHYVCSLIRFVLRCEHANPTGAGNCACCVIGKRPKATFFTFILQMTCLLIHSVKSLPMYWMVGVRLTTGADFPLCLVRTGRPFPGKVGRPCCPPPYSAETQLDGAWLGSFYVITDVTDKELYSNAPCIRPGAACDWASEAYSITSMTPISLHGVLVRTGVFLSLLYLRFSQR